MADPWRHEHVEANGLKIHTVTAGEGPLVLLLHGFPQFWYAWRRQIPALARRFRVVAPDLRGYGDSERPPRVADYTTHVLAGDVAALVRALGYEKAHVVGHDWGGGVAWTAAIEQPQVVDRLAILNCPHPVAFARALRSNPRQLLRSWYMFFFQLPAIPELAFQLGGARLVERAFRGWSVRKDTFDDEDLRQYRAAMQKPGAMTAAINYYRAAFRDFALLRALESAPPKIASPTLLIWGEEDAALGKELTYGMDALFAGPFRIEYVPRCSHWVNEEQPELVNLWLEEFLSAAS